MAFRDIHDGLSNTLLVGEKHVRVGGFGVGWIDGAFYNGDYPTSCTRAGGPAYPLARTPHDPGWRFGSWHPGVCQFLFADGGVHALPLTTSPVTLGVLADIADGQPTPDW
jgi:prepilin-type processing-associated H-X9-DG protein